MKAKASKDLIEWKERKVKVSALKPYERNPRRISEAAFKRLVEGIRRNGYHQRIIATPDLRVIGGHQRIKALKELGIADVMVLTPDILFLRHSSANYWLQITCRSVSLILKCSPPTSMLPS